MRFSSKWCRKLQRRKSAKLAHKCVSRYRQLKTDNCHSKLESLEERWKPDIFQVHTCYQSPLSAYSAKFDKTTNFLVMPPCEVVEECPGFSEYSVYLVRDQLYNKTGRNLEVLAVKHSHYVQTSVYLLLTTRTICLAAIHGSCRLDSKEITFCFEAVREYAVALFTCLCFIIGK